MCGVIVGVCRQNAGPIGGLRDDPRPRYGLTTTGALRAGSRRISMGAVSARSDDAILATLVDDLPLAVWVARAPGGEFVYANARFADIMGQAGLGNVAVGEYAEPYGIYGTDGALYPEGSMPFVRALRERHSVMVDDIVIHRGDGRRINVRAHARPVFSPEGEVTHVVIAFSDITAEARAERALEEVVAEQAFVLEHMGDFVYRHDTDGVFFYLSPAVEWITGHSVEDWKGHYGQFMTDHVDNARVHALTDAALRTGERQPAYRVEVRHADGRPITLEVNEQPYRQGGRVAGIVGVARDVTAHVAAERASQALNQRLTEKNRELEDIIHIASHDLRTPLVSLGGFASELAELVDGIEPDLLPPALQDDARFLGTRIRRSVERLDRRLSGLLTLSRLGRIDSCNERVDVEALFAGLVEDASVPLARAGATLEIGPLPACRGDKAQLAQTFGNLVDNAIKYLDPDRPGRIVVYGERVGDQVAYIVADNGVGIAPAFRDKVFQIFHRLDPRWCAGEGLGLTIAQRIVARHGGRIEISDNPGGGARFTVMLPAG